MFLLMQELYASLECVYHVSERVFTICPVYTPSQPANFLSTNSLLGHSESSHSAFAPHCLPALSCDKLRALPKFLIEHFRVLTTCSN